MYIILEAFDEDYTIPMMNEDGTTTKFDDRKEAEEYAEKNAQKPIIVFLPEYYKGERIDVRKRVIDTLSGLTDHLSNMGCLEDEEEEMLDEAINDVRDYL